MLLERLTLEDIGTYSGRQSFDLTPRKRYGLKRSIILFGGLNGAGKTTFLTAVRLVLYGKQSLESGTSQKEYEQFLRDLIHRPRHSTVTRDMAEISLEFIYARFGVRDRYKVVRTWEERGQSGISERLKVIRSGEAEEILTGEQAQAFLNQMIPPGVAQFFFFDGEKIAALAKDDSDVVLADAIRRLLGLDLADRLGSDLNVYLRQRQTNRVDAKTREEIKQLQAELDLANAEVDACQDQLTEQLVPALGTAKEELERKRSALSERGGAWAVNRKELEAELEQLHTQRVELESQLRESLNGIAVFSLVPKLGKKLVSSLQFEQAQAEQEALAKSIQVQIDTLKQRIAMLEGMESNQEHLVECIDTWVEGLLPPKSELSVGVLHGLTAGDTRSVVESLATKVPLAAREVTTIFGRASSLVQREDEIQNKLAHAPDDETLKEAFDALTKAAEDVARLEVERRNFIEMMRRKTWACIDLVRRLKKLEARVVVEENVEDGEAVAESLLTMIADFKLEAARSKCETLRGHFMTAFSRLARKDDIVNDARIDPHDFTVTLLDHAGREVPKKRLSAGEKQIYAIAMLEALAKTSGRSLPIIIDTPLGRLDSKHRSKLVEAYFPVASHQVVVLSTDTEVDAPFYKGLQKHISHAFHLSFDPDEGATTVEEGYFWKNDQEVAYAS